MEPNLVKVSGRVAVVGDIHGQYYDLAWLLEHRLEGEKEHLLFLGDYVDRGCFSIEVLVLLLALKLNSPGRVTLLRGNHECEQMTSYFNFKQECTAASLRPQEIRPATLRPRPRPLQRAPPRGCRQRRLLLRSRRHQRCPY